MTTDGEPPADISGPTVPRMILGNQLHRFREAAGISPDRAGYEIRASRSKISRMENGRIGFKHRDVTDLLDLYGVTDPQVEAGILELLTQANTPAWWVKYADILPGWFEPYLGLEASAVLIRSFDLQFINGLLQTPEYARAVIRLGMRHASASEVERHLTGQETEPHEILYFKVYKSQLPVIEGALETVGLMLGSNKSRGYCLEMICADFLTGAELGETQQ